MLLGGGSMTPCGGIVGLDDVDFGERGLGVGEGWVEPDCLEEKAESVFMAGGDAIELRELVVGARIAWLALDPGALFGDLNAGFVVEGEVYRLAPETHNFARRPEARVTRIIRTSATLVFVGPVFTRSPRDSK